MTEFSEVLLLIVLLKLSAYYPTVFSSVLLFGDYFYILFAICNYYLAVGTKSKGAPAGISGSVLILFEYSESIFPA